MISKKKLQENVNKTKGETKSALLLIWNELNNGQRKKLVRNPAIKVLLVRYGVIEGDTNAD